MPRGPETRGFVTGPVHLARDRYPIGTKSGRMSLQVSKRSVQRQGKLGADFKRSRIASQLRVRVADVK